MSAELDLKQYNAVAREALVPFDQSEISTREGAGGQNFSYVPPERYRYRLLRIFKNGYAFGIIPGTVTVTKTGVQADFRLRGELLDETEMNNVVYDVTATAFEPYTFKRESTEILNIDQTFSKLMSAGLKLCARKLGLGLHLYDNPARQASGGGSKPSSGGGGYQSGAGVDPNGDHFDPNWTGADTIAYSKHKGTPYNQLEDGMISFCCNLTDRETGAPKPDVKALKERARRQKAAASGNASSDDLDDDDIPF